MSNVEVDNSCQHLQKQQKQNNELNVFECLRNRYINKEKELCDKILSLQYESSYFYNRLYLKIRK